MPFKMITSCVCFVLLLGCVKKEDDEELKTSSDFTTAEIEAHYAVEVIVDEDVAGNTVHFYANFYGNGQALELTGEDEVSAVINSTSEPLLSEESTGIANYSLVELLDNVDSNYVFELSRSNYESAMSSFVKIPQAFESTEPLAENPIFVAENKFLLRWENVALADPEPEAITDGKRFTLRYDFDCRNDINNINAVGSRAEDVSDNGIHEVDLNWVFDIPLGGGSFNRCDHFEITLIRSDRNDQLVDSVFKGGSSTGAQVRFIRGLSIEGMSN